MTITLELWHLVTLLVSLLVSFFTFAFGFSKVLLRQIEKSQDSRYAAQEEMRKESTKHWDQEFGAIKSAAAATDRSLMALKLHVSENYVRREDHVRSQTVIEAKLDALASKFESLLLRAGALKDKP